jgi:hypothetical protein
LVSDFFSSDLLLNFYSVDGFSILDSTLVSLVFSTSLFLTSSYFFSSGLESFLISSFFTSFFSSSFLASSFFTSFYLGSTFGAGSATFFSSSIPVG